MCCTGPAAGIAGGGAAVVGVVTATTGTCASTSVGSGPDVGGFATPTRLVGVWRTAGGPGANASIEARAMPAAPAATRAVAIPALKGPERLTGPDTREEGEGERLVSKGKSAGSRCLGA